MRRNCGAIKIEKKYIAIFAGAVLLTWIFHELAHLIAGEMLGYKMKMTLNSTYPAVGEHSSDLHNQIISAAGPIFTLCEAAVVCALMYWRKRILLYPFLFTCFYMRCMALFISLFNSNDEARISTAMGIGKFTLPIIVSGTLFYMVYKISLRYALSQEFNLANLGLAILFSWVLILTDMFFHINLI